LLIAATIVVGRLTLRVSSPADWSESSLFSAFTYASARIRPLLTSPFDFLVTAVAAGSMVALIFAVVEAWRIAWHHRRLAATGGARLAMYAATHLGAGVVVAFLVVGYERFLHDTVGNTTLDLLHLSVHPWNPARLALQIGLIVWHASALALAVLVLRAGSVFWRVPRRTLTMQALTIALWAAPLAVWELGRAGIGPHRVPSLVAAAAVIATTMLATRIKARFRHGSTEHPDARSRRSGARLLPGCVSDGVASKGAARGDEVRAAGDQSAADDSVVAHRKPHADRSVPRNL
jgi:hypothetical protein